MRCTSPRTVSQAAEGQPLNWRSKHYNGKDRIFQLPCGKCLECRLEKASQDAVRCVHEASCHEQNSFITLTYTDENLKCERLQYEDFQQFMRRLRFHYPNQEIGYIVTGEYGDKNKRPHWHALLFGWRPKDEIYSRKNDNGDFIFKSEILDELWGKGLCEFGQVDYKSAGYVCRYAAKKLVHGKDQDHNFHPIAKRSSKYAIGKKFLEKHWRDIFNYGSVVLSNCSQVPIPRYYEKWLKENQPDDWQTYVTEIKLPRIEKATAKEAIEECDVFNRNWERLEKKRPLLITKHKIRSHMTKERFARLQRHLKGDI